jgi:hypothetical protein
MRHDIMPIPASNIAMPKIVRMKWGLRWRKNRERCTEAGGEKRSFCGPCEEPAVACASYLSKPGAAANRRALTCAAIG